MLLLENESMVKKIHYGIKYLRKKTYSYTFFCSLLNGNLVTREETSVYGEKNIEPYKSLK